MKTQCRNPIIAVLIIAAVLMVNTVAVAETAQAKFKVTVAAASKKGQGFDPKLGRIKKQLSQLGQFTKFRYVSSTSFALSAGNRKSFSIAGGVKGSIGLKSVKNRRAAFNFKLSSRSKNVDINYSLAIGGATIVVGPKTGSETYVIVIQAVK